MAYNKTNWVDRVTPVNAENMNKIENQLETLTSSMVEETEISELKQNVQTLLTTTTNNTTNITTNRNNITSNTQNVNTLTTKVGELEATTQGHTTNITTLETKTDYLKSNGNKYEFLNGQGQYGINLLEVVAISETEGNITLTDNKVHRGTFSGDITFTLPTITEHITFHQMLLQANVTTNINITWNTNLSFGLKSTTLTTGKYNLIFEHNGTDWVYGILEAN